MEKHPRLASLLLVSGSIAIALLIAEALLRLEYEPGVVADPVLGNIGNPGGEIDTNGFRNTRVPEQVDIVAIGDSQTYGTTATREEAWPQILGTTASSSVYQFAIGGYGPAEYSYLLDRALALDPKIVLVGFYLGNDLENAARVVYQNEHFASWRDSSFDATQTIDDTNDLRVTMQNGYAPGSIGMRIYDIRTWIRTHSRVYTLLGNGTRGLREALGLADTKTEIRAQVEAYATEHPEQIYHVDDEGVETLLSAAYRFDALDIDKPFTAEGWKLSREIFRSMNNKTEAAGAKFAIVVIPTKEDVYIRYFEKRGEIPEPLRAFGEKEAALHNAIRNFCAKERISCVFTESALRDSLLAGVPVYPVSGNSHPNAAGYAAIASSTREELIKLKLLP